VRLRYLIVASGLFLGCAAPAGAGDRNAYTELDAQLEQLLSPQVWLRGKVTESDVSLLFDYIKSSMFAASQGLPPPGVPEELKQRAERLKQDLKLQGSLTGLLLLNALEAAARQAVREGLVDPEPRR
jgi:hypothetical protein